MLPLMGLFPRPAEEIGDPDEIQKPLLLRRKVVPTLIKGGVPDLFEYKCNGAWIQFEEIHHEDDNYFAIPVAILKLILYKPPPAPYPFTDDDSEDESVGTEKHTEPDNWGHAMADIARDFDRDENRRSQADLVSGSPDTTMATDPELESEHTDRQDSDRDETS